MSWKVASPFLTTPPMQMTNSRSFTTWFHKCRDKSLYYVHDAIAWQSDRIANAIHKLNQIRKRRDREHRMGRKRSLARFLAVSKSRKVCQPVMKAKCCSHRTWSIASHFKASLSRGNISVFTHLWFTSAFWPKVQAIMKDLQFVNSHGLNLIFVGTKQGQHWRSFVALKHVISGPLSYYELVCLWPISSYPLKQRFGHFQSSFGTFSTKFS